MAKETASGKSYAAAIASNPMRNPKSKAIKAEAFNAYKIALRKDKEEALPLRLKKLEEDQKALLASKDEREATKKIKKLAKNKARRDRQSAKKVEEIDQVIKEEQKTEQVITT